MISINLKIFKNNGGNSLTNDWFHEYPCEYISTPLSNNENANRYAAIQDIFIRNISSMMGPVLKFLGKLEMINT